VNQPSVLLVGDVDGAEFQQCLAWLRQNARLTVSSSLTFAARWLQSDSAADCRFIMLVQQRPGQFSRRDVERLHGAAPLARLVGLLGSWCEGETRSGHPFHGVIRIYWHQFPWRAAWEWKALQSGYGSWSLARTASDADRLLSPAGPSAGAAPRGMLVLRAASHVTYETLSDVCSAAGWSSIWWPPRQPLRTCRPAALVLDAECWTRREQDELAAAAADLAPAPTLALVGFPRIQDVESWRAPGISAVVSKPFLNEDLLAALTSTAAVQLRRAA
jgi:CheY-like chemotaxis protein